MGNSAPQASVSFEFTPGDDATAGGYDFQIIHEGGAQLSVDELGLAYTLQDGTTASGDLTDAPFSLTTGTTYSAGDTIVTSGDGSLEIDEGSEIRLTWSSPSGGSTATIAKATVPN